MKRFRLSSHRPFPVSPHRSTAEVHGAAAELSLSEVDLEQIDCIMVGSVAASGRYAEDPAQRAEVKAR
jgi:predicted CoA-binding protein